jgi:hypothetical protein
MTFILIPRREMRATITISGEEIRERAAIDRALTARMESLSDIRKKKSWRRIQSHRWWKVIHKEVLEMERDIKRRMESYLSIRPLLK